MVQIHMPIFSKFHTDIARIVQIFPHTEIKYGRLFSVNGWSHAFLKLEA
jgi:hypothetical protein